MTQSEEIGRYNQWWMRLMTPTASLPKHTIRSGLQNGVAAEANDNRLESFFNSMVLIGVFIAIIYVALDTILHIFYSDRFNLIASAVGEDLYEIYIRIIVLCLFAIFGSHAQYTINNLKKKGKRARHLPQSPGRTGQ